MVPRETEASRRGVEYRVANGATILNKGELNLTGAARNGVKMNVISQTANVTKPLASAREIIKAGNRIVLDEDTSYIENKKTNKRIPIDRKIDMFIVTLRVKKENKDKNKPYDVMAADDQPSFHR